MKCKCKNIIPEGRLRLGFKACVNCSSVEAYGCAPVINHKTGNSIQIMSSEDAKKIANQRITLPKVPWDIRGEDIKRH